MDEYLKLGHMKEVPFTKINQRKYYIPHQAVIREENTTMKLRVVFDASCKPTTDLSLNRIMYIGPKLQNDLVETLLRWRKYRIAFTADIEKMERHITMYLEDQPYQRILWRCKPTQPLQEYQLTTLTYGTTSAPFLAIGTLQQLAKDESNNHPVRQK
ncbi:hypothetical protein JTB14_035483 [Gonioctena quinquepunctata]|nr:hypothetical protein JTB14_035483 [Gonioctena quinquepunctata]